MTDRFSAEAWEGAVPWFDAIRRHPFVTGLSDGTLEKEVFWRYIVDDSQYLIWYASALTTVASRWPDPVGAATWARFGADTVAAERDLHAALLRSAGIDLSGDDLPAPTPTCLAYTGTLQTWASLAPVEVAAAGVLPCFRVYAEVGALLASALSSQPDHPYRDWVSMYGDPVFAADTRHAEEMVDQAADQASEVVRAAMHDAYAQATRFEWMFWDASFRGELWPTPDGAYAAHRMFASSP